MFGSAYGLEHVQERMKFLQALREAHEEDENAFPFTYCVQLFEEMIAVWCEEVRERRRLLCAKLGTENPRSRGPQTLGTGTWSRQAPEFPVPTNLGPDGPFGAITSGLSSHGKTRPWHGC